MKHIGDRVSYFASKVGVEPKKVVIKDHSHRWASCTSDGTVTFNWKCMMAPTKIIDYVVVHELCHIHVRDHSQSFWNEVDKVIPDYRERKLRLRKHGAALDL